LDDNAVNNCTDLLVVSPKPYGSHPHNPQATMSAKYIDPASSDQLENVHYDIEFVNQRQNLYTTVRTFGIQSKPKQGDWSFLQIQSR
jgi:hypothetical protein